jgi:hypothetical protein
MKSGVGVFVAAGTWSLGEANLIASLIVAGLTATYLVIQICKALRPRA